MIVLNGPKIWKQVIHCSCSAKLKIFSEDIKIGRFEGSYCEKEVLDLYVECAICGRRIRLKHIPSNIRDEVKKHKGA